MLPNFVMVEVMRDSSTMSLVRVVCLLALTEALQAFLSDARGTQI